MLNVLKWTSPDNKELAPNVNSATAEEHSAGQREACDPPATAAAAGTAARPCVQPRGVRDSYSGWPVRAVVRRGGDPAAP